MAKRLHKIVKDKAPDLSPKTWDGMPAYANEDGKAMLFKARVQVRHQIRRVSASTNRQRALSRGACGSTASR